MSLPAAQTTCFRLQLTTLMFLLDVGFHSISNFLVSPLTNRTATAVTCHGKIKVRSYIAWYPSPQDHSKRFTLHPLADLFIQTTSQPSLGSIQPCCNYCTKTIHSHTHHCFIARYSFIQLSELRQQGVNKTAKVSKWQQEDSNAEF